MHIYRISNAQMAFFSFNEMFLYFYFIFLSVVINKNRKMHLGAFIYTCYMVNQDENGTIYNIKDMLDLDYIILSLNMTQYLSLICVQC